MLRLGALAMIFGACSLHAIGCDLDDRETVAAIAAKMPPPPTVEVAARAAATAAKTARSMPPGPTVEVAGIASLPHRPLLRLGHGTADFVLYDDGLVLVPDPAARYRRMLGANIGPSAAAALAAEVVSDGFFGLPAFGPSCGIADLHATTILVRDGARWHQATYYGIGESGVAVCSVLKARGLAAFTAPIPHEPIPDEPPPPDEYSPPSFTRPYLRLLNFQRPSPAPWIAEAVRIEIGGYDHALNVAPWPDGVPLPDASTKPLDAGYIHHVVAGRYAGRVHAFEESLGPKTAVEANGFKWSFIAHDVYPAEDYLEKVVQALNEAPP